MSKEHPNVKAMKAAWAKEDAEVERKMEDELEAAIAAETDRLRAEGANLEVVAHAANRKSMEVTARMQKLAAADQVEWSRRASALDDRRDFRDMILAELGDLNKQYAAATATLMAALDLIEPHERRVRVIQDIGKEALTISRRGR